LLPQRTLLTGRNIADHHGWHGWMGEGTRVIFETNLRVIPFLDPCSHFLRAVRSVCQAAGGRGTSLAKRRVDDPAPIGGAGAPPSRLPDYFRIDPEME
jgi:hypothetical protein